MAYSPDYRELIVSKLNEGATYRALERDYKLSRTTILKWKKDISRKLRVAKPTKIDNEKLKEDGKRSVVSPSLVNACLLPLV